jgi:hypothetical protein
MTVYNESSKEYPADTFTPKKATRYDRGDLNDTLYKAGCLSLGNNLTYFVVCTAYGFAITLDKPSFGKYFQIMPIESNYARVVITHFVPQYA